MANISSASRTPRKAEAKLVRLALDVGALDIGGTLTADERRLVSLAEQECRWPEADIQAARSAIAAGWDPLGESLCRIRSAVERRAVGAFYTPPALVKPMLNWVLAQDPQRIVDPGCGSGRFTVGIVRRAPDFAVIAVDLDPMATLLTRAALAVLGARNVTVLQADYTDLHLPPIEGRTAFVSNPPYVRHHDLTPGAKARAVVMAKSLGCPLSGLAGLHTYFYLATALHARPGDVGCFVTSAEWLDVGYGSAIRSLLLGKLGGQSLHVLEPRAVPFEDAMSTAAIACFTVGMTPPVLQLRLVDAASELGALDIGHEVTREVLTQTRRWAPLLQARPSLGNKRGQVPLREIVRVHRGAVTGANDYFLFTRERARELGLEQWCKPAITSAEEILRSGGVVRNAPQRRLLLDIPGDVARQDHPELDAYLKRGEEATDGKPPLAQRYIPSHRRPWWRVGTLLPPPIVVSYMARQAPVFALNPDGLALINIAHGLYPVRPLSEDQLAALVAYLNRVRDSFRGNGRTYHGGLEKFEPSELEALLVPTDGPWS